MELHPNLIIALHRETCRSTVNTNCSIRLHVKRILTWVSYLFSRETYSEFVPEGVLANALGLLLLAYGVVIGYVVTREEFKRPPHPEEEALSVHFKTLTEGGAISPWLLPSRNVLKGGWTGELVLENSGAWQHIMYLDSLSPKPNCRFHFIGIVCWFTLSISHSSYVWGASN